MQGVWEDALEDYTWNVQVSDLKDMQNLTFNFSACYKRLFQKKKKDKIDLSSGDDVMEIKPCCSSSLKD
jgi:hypothetical protein